MPTNKPKPHPALKILERHKALVWPEINKNLKDPDFPKQFSIPKRYEKLQDFHWKIVSEYPNRKGKYLRPTLLMLTAKALGANPKSTVKTAAAMQISEEWILNHDDIEDNSPLRRGLPALHKKYGVELALNAGDTLHSVMWKLLMENLDLLGTKKTIEIMEEFYKIVMRTTLGQTIDIKWFLENKPDIKDEDWYFIADSKSSYYTIAAPIRLGAIIANAKKVQLDKLADLGLQLGRSFQLTDDILDITSDFGGLKQLGNDVYEGKRTIILGHLLRKASVLDKQKILNILSKPRDEKSANEVNSIIKKMNDYGSIEYAQRLAHDFKNNALDIFEKDLKFLSKEPARSELETLIHFIVERDH